MTRLRQLFAGLDFRAAILLGTGCVTVLLAPWLIAAAVRKATKREVAARAANQRLPLFKPGAEPSVEAGPCVPVSRPSAAVSDSGRLAPAHRLSPNS